MVAMYKIAGMQVGSHYLAMATLGSLGALTYSFIGGSPKKTAGSAPPINAGSKDEESFIKDFLSKAEQDGKKGSADAKN